MSEEKIISEYNVNRYLYPVNKATTEDYFVDGTPPLIVKAGCTLTLHCFQVLDCIASIIREGMEKHFVKSGLRLNQVTDNFKLMEYPHLIYQLQDGFEKEDEAQFNMRKTYGGPMPPIPIAKLMKHPTIKSMQRHGLNEALKKLNNFEFKTTFKFYSIRDMLGKDMRGGYHGVYTNLDKEFSKLFDIEFLDGSKGVNNKNYRSSIVLHFNTIFGYIFLHNIYTKGFSYQNETFEKIKRCSTNAKLVYRRFILPHSYSAKLTVEKISSYLGLKTNNKWNSKIILDRIVKEYVDNELIEIESSSNANKDYYYMVKKSIYPT